MILVFDNHINFFFYQKAPIPFLESSGNCILKIFHVGSLLRLRGSSVFVSDDRVLSFINPVYLCTLLFSSCYICYLFERKKNGPKCKYINCLVSTRLIMLL